MVLTEHEEIPLKDLPEELYEQPTTRASLWPFSGLSIKANTIALEKDLIEKALKETNRNRTKAARHLEISYPTLLAKMKAYGIS
jgi:two-component system response regulator AtoC